MSKSTTQLMVPKVITWGGLLFLTFLTGIGLIFFGQDFAIALIVGMAVGLANFKAIVFIVKRALGPHAVHKVLYGIFGLLKFFILGLIFFVFIYYKMFDVFGIVAGFSAVLMLVLIEGLIRASRFVTNESTEERGNAERTTDVSELSGA